MLLLGIGANDAVVMRAEDHAMWRVGIDRRDHIGHRMGLAADGRRPALLFRSNAERSHLAFDKLDGLLMAGRVHGARSEADELHDILEGALALPLIDVGLRRPLSKSRRATRRGAHEAKKSGGEETTRHHARGLGTISMLSAHSASTAA